MQMEKSLYKQNQNTKNHYFGKEKRNFYATKERLKPESHQREHPHRESRREATKASGGDRTQHGSEET